MRKIIAAEMMSLDGVIDTANQLVGQYSSALTSGNRPKINLARKPGLSRPDQT